MFDDLDYLEVLTDLGNWLEQHREPDAFDRVQKLPGFSSVANS
jgi:hypothetical protein